MYQNYVYLTTNLINGKQYVGDHTINLKEKKYYLGSGKYLRKAIKKYGGQNFFKEILEWLPTRQEAFAAQEKYIRFYRTHISKGGYNISWKGGSQCKGGISDETKKKISNKIKGIKRSPETRRKIGIGNSISLRGKKQSKETIEKRMKTMGAPWNKGTRNIYSEKTLEKMKNSHIGNSSGMKEKKHKMETIEKMKTARQKIARLKCIYCGKILDIANYTRWHNNNCKLKFAVT